MIEKIRSSNSGPHFSEDGTPLSPYAWLMIAHHEAGHAVVGTWFGFFLKHLHLRAENRCPVARWTGHRRNSPLRPMVVLAGAASSRRYDAVLDRTVLGGASVDLDEFIRLVPDEKERQPYISATNLLVLAMWPVIEEVAWELFKKSELPGDRVREIVRVVAEVESAKLEKQQIQRRKLNVRRTRVHALPLVDPTGKSYSENLFEELEERG